MSEIHDGDLQTLSDEALIARFTMQPLALSVLLRRYQPLAERMARRYTANYADVEDLTQEGLIELLAAALRFEPDRGAAFRTYVAVCMRNRMSDVMRRLYPNHGFPVVSLDDPDLSPDVLPADSHDSPEQLLLQKELDSEFHAQLNDVLSKREWEILCLLAGGSSYEEIAQRLRISRKSVDNAIQRARRKLRAVRSSQIPSDGQQQ